MLGNKLIKAWLIIFWDNSFKILMAHPCKQFVKIFSTLILFELYNYFFSYKIQSNITMLI